MGTSTSIFLEWFEGRFLMELMNEPTRRDIFWTHYTDTGKNWLKLTGLEVALSEGTGALQGVREVSKAKSRITAMSLRGAGIWLLG